MDWDSRDGRYSLSKWRGSCSPLENDDALVGWVAWEDGTQVHQAPLLEGSAGILHGGVAIGGHCHLELMHQWVSLRSSRESALGALAKCRALTELAGLEAVVTNSIFRDEWTANIPVSIGNILMLQNCGMLRKVVRYRNVPIRSTLPHRNASPPPPPTHGSSSCQKLVALLQNRSAHHF